MGDLATRRMERLALILSDYSFIALYVPGIYNVLAGSVSRVLRVKDKVIDLGKFKKSDKYAIEYAFKFGDTSNVFDRIGSGEIDLDHWGDEIAAAYSKITADEMNSIGDGLGGIDETGQNIEGGDR